NDRQTLVRTRAGGESCAEPRQEVLDEPAPECRDRDGQQIPERAVAPPDDPLAVAPGACDRSQGVNGVMEARGTGSHRRRALRKLLFRCATSRTPRRLMPPRLQVCSPLELPVQARTSSSPAEIGNKPPAE